MPTIKGAYLIDITPEKFLANCSDEEIIELDLLLCAERYQNIIRKHNESAITISLQANKEESKQ